MPVYVQVWGNPKGPLLSTLTLSPRPSGPLFHLKNGSTPQSFPEPMCSSSQVSMHLLPSQCFLQPGNPQSAFFFFFFQPRGLTSKRLPLPFQREALALQRAEALLQHCSGWASSDVHVVGLGTCGRGKEEGIASYWVFPRFLRLHQEPDPPPPQHT